MTVLLDHLVVAAASLEQGVAWCEATLGVTPVPGGRHALMGTHNRLLKLAGAAYPDAYLEIIAIDPAAAAPARPRWFGLDDPALQARLAAAPRLIHAVARSTMLDMHRWGLITVGCRPGDPVSASRETQHGRLAWQILVRDDGGLDCGGALPSLIQWQGEHPAQRLPASGVALRSLVLSGVPARARDVLRLRGVSVQLAGEAALVAVLATPHGDVTLSSG
ncbi:MAG: VOC family protein [Burkholderiales bacterium]|nr:VOC family protein [Burkholderiales bacterium]